MGCAFSNRTKHDRAVRHRLVSRHGKFTLERLRAWQNGKLLCHLIFLHQGFLG